jgi:subfamily B ATP-binding cassette protein HlyB/CyaB
VEAFSDDEFVWLVGSLCRIFSRPFDALLLVAQYPAPRSRESLQDALDELGLAAKEQTLGAKALAKLLPPYVAFLKPGPGSAKAAAHEDPALVTGVLIVQSDAERITYFRPGTESPETLSRAEFVERFQARIIKIGRKPSGTEELADPADQIGRAHV